jgi:hypothetical protein
MATLLLLTVGGEAAVEDLADLLVLRLMLLNKMRYVAMIQLAHSVIMLVASVVLRSYCSSMFQYFLNYDNA